MKDAQFDVVIAGGGPAGLAAACIMASAERRVCLIAGTTRQGDDPRTVALMQPAINLLAHIGLWPGEIAGAAAPLKRLRLVDDMKGLISAPEVMFDAKEVGLEAFGWNIPLARLVPALKQTAAHYSVALLEADAADFHATEEMATVQLSDGSAISSPLIIAADGRNSNVRKAAGIAIEEWAYDQSAIATSFSHSQPHRDISTEYHRPGGPFTTVPLPGKRSSLVWMERPERAETLLALSDDAFAGEIQLATHGELGLILGVGPRRLFPMRGLRALQLAANRLMLVGEAAHVVPPIGAQGLNMSFRDIAEIFDIVSKIDDIGGPEAIDRYTSIREADVRPRQAAIDAMNRSLLADILWLNGARAGAIAALGTFRPLREFAMWRGLKPPGRLPTVMQKQA